MFKTLFGTGDSKINETCVLIPFISKEIMQEFGISDISRGLLYSTGTNGAFSVIICRMGAGFAGDAVLHLKDTPCKNIVFFGSCGSAKNSLKAGTVVAVEKALSQDSFTGMLMRKPPNGAFYPDKDLLNTLCANTKAGVMRGACLTAASLKLENEYIQTLKDKEIDVVDMETSAVFSASASAGKRSAAFLFVTDVMNANPYYTAYNKDNRDKLKEISRNSAKIVYRMISALAIL